MSIRIQVAYPDPCHLIAQQQQNIDIIQTLEWIEYNFGTKCCMLPLGTASRQDTLLIWTSSRAVQAWYLENVLWQLQWQNPVKGGVCIKGNSQNSWVCVKIVSIWFHIMIHYIMSQDAVPLYWFQFCSTIPTLISESMECAQANLPEFRSFAGDQHTKIAR